MEAITDPRIKDANVPKPLVSIIITNYNYAQFLIPCLNSVVRQTYPTWECILVDDVSSDNSIQVIEEFLAQTEKPEKFTLVRRTENGGQMEAFHDGLKLAKGTFCMMLDADDVLLNDFLETHIRAHLGRKAVAFTTSNQYQINKEGSIIAGDHPDHLSKGNLLYVPELPLHSGYWIWATASSMLFRTDTLRLIMPKPGVTFRICADYYMAQFANQLGNSLLIPTIHGCYRRHGDNNFGNNPVVGAINSVGCLDQHPPHDEFRWTMINHIIENYDTFYRIYMDQGVVRILTRIAKFKEFIKIIMDNRTIFPKNIWVYIRLYLLYHIPRWRRHRKTWPEKLIVVDSGYFYEGDGENSFP